MSDYDCSITKSWEKKSNQRYNQVPQLGEQPKQRVPDLKVLSKEDEALAEFVAETGLTKLSWKRKKKSQFMKEQAENHLYWDNLLCGQS